jgi:biotin transport system ATP-binding protein
MDNEDIIAINRLTHRFANGRLGLRDIRLRIPQGAFVVIAGANGSGKTTLLRYFNGLLLAPKGVVMVDGKDVRDDVRMARRKVGMVFQDADSQIVGETVRDDVAFGPENLCWPSEKIQHAVNEALSWVGLTHLADQSPHLLSGGERRRLAIAGVLAMKPQVVVLDEPFANLDFLSVRQTLTHIVNLHASGHTIVVSAHDLEKVIAHAQRLVVLDQGRMAADGAPETILPGIETFGIRLPCSVRMGRPLESWLN